MSVRTSQWILAVSVVVLATSFGLRWTPAVLGSRRPTPSPVRCAAPVHEAGTVFAGETIAHEFSLVNHGKSPLTVHKILMQCGCTSVAADLLGTVVGPGDALTVPLKLDVSSTPGPMRKSAYVVFTELPASSVELTFVADVRPAYTVTPPHIVLGELTPDAAVQGEAAVVFAEGGPVHAVLGANSNHGQLSPEVQSSEEGAARVVVRTKPPLPVGRISAMVFLQLETGMISIPVSGTVRPAEDRTVSASTGSASTASASTASASTAGAP